MDVAAPPLILAVALLGAQLSDGVVTLRITEVEAYGGLSDPAAHAFRGWRPHTRSLFAEPGTLYCYRSRGLHTCGNVVCGPAGSGSAVLLRAAEVIGGLEVARERRHGVPDVRLARGPGCLGQAMGWTLADDGRRFGEGGLSLEAAAGEVGAVATGPRVGVSVAHQRPWRFWVGGDPTVSAYRRSPRAVTDDRAW